MSIHPPPIPPTPPAEGTDLPRESGGEVHRPTAITLTFQQFPGTDIGTTEHRAIGSIAFQATYGTYRNTRGVVVPNRPNSSGNLGSDGTVQIEPWANTILTTLGTDYELDIEQLTSDDSIIGAVMRLELLGYVQLSDERRAEVVRILEEAHVTSPTDRFRSNVIYPNWNTLVDVLRGFAAFQKNIGIAATARPDTDTRRRLRDAVPLRT